MRRHVYAGKHSVNNGYVKISVNFFEVSVDCGIHACNVYTIRLHKMADKNNNELEVNNANYDNNYASNKHENNIEYNHRRKQR